MYFTLAISAAAPSQCLALTRAALAVDARSLPLPGPARLTWQAPDGRAAMVCWGRSAPSGRCAESYGGTIWAGPAGLCARTGVARVSPVYAAEVPGAVVLSDRASWAAAVCGRLDDLDPVTIAAVVCLAYPLDAGTPFRGVRAVGGARSLTASAGCLADRPAVGHGVAVSGVAVGDGSAGGVADALVAAVGALAAGPVPVELSLTGGKDSRLIAAALAAAGIPFRARTHGAADHPDVVVAAAVAGRLGASHTVTEPARPGTVTPADVLVRLRAAVLVGDGMLSAFENLGRPDPADLAAAPVQVGGHGGELLRGGYAAYAGNAVRGAAHFRRLTTRRLSLLRRPAARGYLAGLAPWAASFARGPLRALDEFYLVNRAGRWSAAARQAYLLRAHLVQPFFDDRVVQAARAVRLRGRVSGQLHRGVLTALCPGLLELPLAGPGPRRSDWRRGYDDDVATFLRGYVLDQGPGLFDVISKHAAERVLKLPHADPEAAWSLATVAALQSGDWLNARSAPAVPGFGLPEEHRAGGERDHRPADPGDP